MKSNLQTKFQKLKIVWKICFHLILKVAKEIWQIYSEILYAFTCAFLVVACIKNYKANLKNSEIFLQKFKDNGTAKFSAISRQKFI
ncbi:MAG: hypothetical protein ACTTIM_03610 [Campylobacter sp.]